MLAKLHSYGLLDNSTDDIAESLKKKKAMARDVNGFFVERYHMTEELFDKLVDMLDLPVNESKSRNSTRGVDKRPLPCIPMAKQAMWCGGMECEVLVF
jgi:hypothetical protein